MKTIRVFGLLIVSVFLWILFLPFKVTIYLIKVVKVALTIIEKTLTFLMEQIRSEVLK